MKRIESYKVMWFGGHTPIRRETEKGAMALADKLRKQGKHGVVEAVWISDNGIAFEEIRKF